MKLCGFSLVAMLVTTLASAAPGTISGKVTDIKIPAKTFTLTESSGRATDFKVDPSTPMTVNGTSAKLMLAGPGPKAKAEHLKVGDSCNVTADSGTTLNVVCTR